MVEMGNGQLNVEKRSSGESSGLRENDVKPLGIGTIDSEAMKTAKLPSQSKERWGKERSSVHLSVWGIRERAFQQEVKKKKRT